METTCLATENRAGPSRTKRERRVLRAERQLARAVSKQACSLPSILGTFFVLPGPGADFERPLLRPIAIKPDAEKPFAWKASRETLPRSSAQIRRATEEASY